MAVFAGCCAASGLAIALPVWGSTGPTHDTGLTIALADPSPMLFYRIGGLMQDVSLSYRPAARPVGIGQVGAGAADCLSEAVYHEARSEPIDGQQAVAQVVLNRVGATGFPKSVCGVVYQGAASGDHCQFKFVCDGSLYARHEPLAWMRARAIARAALGGKIFASIGRATFFHTAAVSPGWSHRMVKVATVGSHMFYRVTRTEVAGSMSL